MIRHKGYTGIMEVDDEACVIHGRVSGLRDVITFEGDSVAEAVQAFRDSVDDYLEWCAADGRPPEKPFSGKLLVRLDPATHRSLAQLAKARATSVNALVALCWRNSRVLSPPGRRRSGDRPREPTSPDPLREEPSRLDRDTPPDVIAPDSTPRSMSLLLLALFPPHQFPVFLKEPETQPALPG